MRSASDHWPWLLIPPLRQLSLSAADTFQAGGGCGSRAGGLASSGRKEGTSGACAQEARAAAWPSWDRRVTWEQEGATAVRLPEVPRQPQGRCKKDSQSR